MDFGILKKSSQGVSVVPAESELLEKRVLFLSGEINEESAEKFLKQIMLTKGTGDVLLVINSPGGEIASGLTIINAMESAPFKVQTHCLSKCYSMAAVVFACGTGKRTMSPHSKLMFHEPLISGRGMAPLSQVEDEAKLLGEKKELLAKIVADRTGIDKKKIKQIMGRDRYFDEKEAKEWNLCDGIGYASLWG